MKQRHLSILMYHQIGDFKQIKTLKANYCHYKKFSRQMAMLKWTRQTVIPMSKAIDFLQGKGNYPTRCVAITFDDGYENFFHYAFPILKKHKFSAMVYVVSGELSGQSHWVKDKGHKPAALMSLSQIKEVKKNNIEIGSHTVSHPKLATITLEACKKELKESKMVLEKLLDQTIDHICYPYGSCNQNVIRAARELGYNVGTTTIKDLATAQHDALALPRKAVSINDSVFKVWKNLRKIPKKKVHSIIVEPISVTPKSPELYPSELEMQEGGKRANPHELTVSK